MRQCGLHMNNLLLTLTCTKSMMETQIKGVKYAQSQQQRHRNDIFDLTLCFIFKRFHKERKKTKCFNSS